MRAEPESGRRNPAAILSSVVLPPPLGPMRHTNSRSRTSKLTLPSAATVLPLAPAYARATVSKVSLPPAGVFISDKRSWPSPANKLLFKQDQKLVNSEAEAANDDHASNYLVCP